MFTKILGYDVFNGTKEELMNYVEGFDKVNIVSGNPEVLMNGLRNDFLHGSFTSENSVIIPDGIGTVLASKVVKMPVKEKIAGIEVMEEIVKKCSVEGKGVYFIGAQQEVLDKCVTNLKNKYAGLKVCGSHNGFFDLDNCDDLIQDIKSSSPYAIFVAMGSPRQEKFIISHMEELPCKVYMGVGGSFDIFGGKLKRAPEWMIKSGTEWLYRVIKEPSRFKRLGVIPKFLLMVLKNNK